MTEPAAPVISIDTRQLRGLAEVMRAMPREFPGIAKRTINFVGNKAMTQVRRAVAEQSGMTYGDVKDKIKAYPASEASLAYIIHAEGGYTTLIHYAPRQVRGGVSARPWGKRRTFRGAFIVEKYGGNVFKRVSDARGPIDVLYGPAVPTEMMRGAAPSAATFVVAEDFGPRLDHEVKRALLAQMTKHIRASGWRG